MSNTRAKITGRFAGIFTIFLALFLLGSCTEVQFISDYDTYTDENVGKLHRSTEELFTHLERNQILPDCSHQSHMDFYEEATVELNVLTARNNIRPKNDITNSQLGLLKDSLNTLESLHKNADANNKCISVDQIALLRQGFDSSFSAILRLELAKKRGEDEK